MEDLHKVESKVDRLKSKLETFGIDISAWGTGGYKTLDHLTKEIECQEVFLNVNENSELIRISEVVAATIFYTHDDGKKYCLREEKQVFFDGRERVRSSAGQSVFEKMQLGEDPTEAMLRGISEELGIVGSMLLNYVDKVENIADSKSYPGLQTKSTTHLFEAILNSEQFHPQGYREEQPDKVTYFIWESVK